MNQWVLMGAGDILLLHTDGLVEHPTPMTLLRSHSSASAHGVNNAQIASIVVTANQVDIDAGKLAAGTS
jgi:predicted outer membrane protein